MYYGARFYDPALGRFLTADSLTPAGGNPQALNRYGYTLNNPVRYADPTGHYVCEGTGRCRGGGAASTAGNPYDIQFTADEDASWDAHDQNQVLYAAGAIAGQMASALAEDDRNQYHYEGSPIKGRTPEGVFKKAYGSVNFHRSSETCSPARCWAETLTKNLIVVYTDDPTSDFGVANGRYSYQNATHELGHAFAANADGVPYADLAAAKIEVGGVAVAGVAGKGQATIEPRMGTRLKTQRISIPGGRAKRPQQTKTSRTCS